MQTGHITLSFLSIALCGCATMTTASPEGQDRHRASGSATPAGPMALSGQPQAATASGNPTTGTKVAFVGDTGAGTNFQQVLDLIKKEKAQLTIILGDTSYDKWQDKKWHEMVKQTLGPEDPGLVVAGNHDYRDSKFEDLREMSLQRLDGQSKVKCLGERAEHTEKMTCQLNNLYFVMAAIGSRDANDLASRANYETYIADKLNQAPANAWRICAWHKNQSDMQIGQKKNETGWAAYEICRKKGAIIATGHEHSYSRTHLLSSMEEKKIANDSANFTVSEGQTFAFVSGLGGIDKHRELHRPGPWWAKMYAANTDPQSNYGVLFATFHADRADFYFKNIEGVEIDAFSIKKGY